MLDIDELRQDAKESYQKRFDRWIVKSDLEKQIRIAAKKGYMLYSIDLNSGNHPTGFVAMANDKRFMPLLKKEFPDIDIQRDDSEYRDLLGFKHSRNIVVISWE